MAPATMPVKIIKKNGIAMSQAFAGGA